MDKQPPVGLADHTTAGHTGASAHQARVAVNTAQTMRFLDILLLHCLLEDSPPDTPQELESVARNKLRGAQEGRKPDLRRQYGG